MNNVPDTCTSTTCAKCIENNCNDKIFPGDRLRCNECPSTNVECQKDLSQTSDFYKVCSVFKASDKCYAYLVGDKFERGCISTATTAANTECNKANPKNCLTCVGNGCNQEAVKKSSVLKCISCDGTDEEECEWEYRDTEARNCVKDVLYGQREACYATNVEGLVTRGCHLDDEPECDECSLCYENSCNRDAYRKSKCIVCETGDSTNCNENPTEISPTECASNQFYDNRGCYTWKKEDNAVERGCISTLTTDIKDTCLNQNDETCIACFTDGCNNSFASSLKIMVVLVMLGPIIFLFI